MNSGIYVSLLIVVSSVYMPRSGIAGSYGGFIPIKTYFQTKLSPYHKDMSTNSVATNNGIHVYFSILVSSGYMPRSGIAGSYGGFIPRVLGISILSSIVAVSIYIPTNSARVFPFLHSLSSIYCL